MRQTIPKGGVCLIFRWDSFAAAPSEKTVLRRKAPDPGKCTNGVQKVCSRFFLHRKRALNQTIQRSFIGAPPGTRTLGPLIKRNQRATIVNFDNHVDSLFLSFYRKFTFCICCILCTCYSLLHPLSSRSGVQKVCKNVQSQNQTLKTGIGFLCKDAKMGWFGSKPASAISLV